MNEYLKFHIEGTVDICEANHCAILKMMFDSKPAYTNQDQL